MLVRRPWQWRPPHTQHPPSLSMITLAFTEGSTVITPAVVSEALPYSSAHQALLQSQSSREANGRGDNLFVQLRPL